MWYREEPSSLSRLRSWRERSLSRITGELLELDLDGVSVCTPNIAHHRTSIDALEAGKHVLVEKPLAVTLQQGIEMVQAAKKTGKMLTVGFQPRYDPNMVAVKNLVQSGKLGKVYFVETGGGRRRGMPGARSSARSWQEPGRLRISAVIRSIWRSMRWVIRSR
ncbi:Gfo/Idh/MocA family oxidoreductase [Paenibacillus sp. P25]|nr:Gfo/Idh/MocA family oxidoreductase [Paenibacillus sp. P25]